jgi:hypothetical protein
MRLADTGFSGALQKSFPCPRNRNQEKYSVSTTNIPLNYQGQPGF